MVESLFYREAGAGADEKKPVPVKNGLATQHWYSSMSIQFSPFTPEAEMAPNNFVPEPT